MTSDQTNQFLSAMHERGLELSPLQDLRADGSIHRCDVIGKKAGNRDGSYLLRLNGQFAYGWLNNWADERGVEPWHYSNGKHTPTAVEQLEIDRAVEAARDEHAKQLAKARAEARVKAKRIWGNAAKAPAAHPYCRRKQVEPAGLRMVQFGDGDTLLVPIYDEHNKLVNLQFIHADGHKYGLTGGRMLGCHYWVDKPNEDENDATICICEGWATGESIFQATGHAVILALYDRNLVPVAQWVRERYPEHRIVIAADDDWKTRGNPGLSCAKDAARAADGLIAIPSFNGNRADTDTDFNDLLVAAGGEAIHRAIADAVDPDDLETGNAKARELAIIQVHEGQLARGVDEAQDALLKADVPIFVRGRMLVRPITTVRQAAHNRTTMITIFAQLNEHRLAYLLNKHAAIFQRFDKRRGTWVKIDPPKRIIEGLLALGEWKFPEVVGIAGAPTLRPDGSLLFLRGYDPITRLWCHADLELPPITDQPTRSEAEAALRMLEQELLAEFPFVADVDRSVALAAILTVVLRGALELVPIFAILAHDAGTGKSYLVDLVSVIVSGRECPVITASKSAEEMEKQLGAILLEGSSLISLDNVSHDLEGDLLAQMATQKIVKVRVLGRSETPECEWRGTLFATGNNIRVKGDLVRRVLCCNLDARVERPEQRKFKLDPVGRAARDRGRYIAAAISIARAYAAAVHPYTGQVTPLSGFNEWSRMVREPLLWLGRADPVDSMEMARELDPERMAAREVLYRWSQRIGAEAPVTASEVIAIANALKSASPPLYRYPKFRTSLMEVAAGGKGDAIDSRRLGLWLQKVHGRVYDGYRIDLRHDKHAKTNRYVLTVVDDE